MLSKLLSTLIMVCLLSLADFAAADGRCPSYYGSSNSCGGSTSYEPSNRGLLGFAGVLVGSTLKHNPVIGAVAGGLTGYYVGSAMDRRDDEQAAQVAARGRTDCNWHHHGYADSDGHMTVTNSSFDCEGGNENYGNRMLPPAPTDQ